MIMNSLVLKNVVSPLLAVLFLMSMTLGTVHAESAQIPLNNPGFEAGDTSGWVAEGNSLGVDSADAHSGKKCYFWNGSAYKQKLHQTVSGLKNGSYTVKAWVKQNTGLPKVCRMEISDYGGEQVNVKIAHSDSYIQISKTVEVTSGKIDIGFYAESPGSTNLQIDDVELWQN